MDSKLMPIMSSKQTREELEPLDSERAADMYEDAKEYDQDK
jgi:hypothetical protein